MILTKAQKYELKDMSDSVITEYGGRVEPEMFWFRDKRIRGGFVAREIMVQLPIEYTVFEWRPSEGKIEVERVAVRTALNINATKEITDAIDAALMS